MKKTMTFHRKKIWMVFLVCALMLLGLVGRLVYLDGGSVGLLLPESGRTS